VSTHHRDHEGTSALVPAVGWHPELHQDPLAGHRQGVFGATLSRLDGPRKVVGTATFASEFPLASMLYVAVVYSTVTRGRIVNLDMAHVERVPGVALVMTHHNASVLNVAPAFRKEPLGFAGHSVPVMQDDQIRWNGQPLHSCWWKPRRTPQGERRSWPRTGHLWTNCSSTCGTALRSRGWRWTKSAAVMEDCVPSPLPGATRATPRSWNARAWMRCPSKPRQPPFDCGRILNAKTAARQLRGGMVMGLGLALMEQTHVDPRNGRIMNLSLDEYQVPVHTDVPEIEVLCTDIPDPRTPTGARGLGEIGVTGVGAAVANAVHDAAGRRIRELPITLDKLGCPRQR